MDEAGARDWLAASVLPDDQPELNAWEVDQLLALASSPDVEGNPPSSQDWTPTYSISGLNHAAAEGWRRKAGKAAPLFTFTADGQRFERAAIYAHCISQADRYARMACGSVRT